MTRVYSVTFENPELPLSFTAVSIPESDPSALEELGIEVKVPFMPHGSLDATGVLRDLVVFDALREGRDTRSIELSWGANQGVFYEFLSFVAREAYIPVERSPLSGASLEEMMRQANLLGFGTFTAGNLIHQDPVVYVSAPPTTIVVGACVGAVEGLRMRAQHLLSPPSKAARPRKSRKPAP